MHVDNTYCHRCGERLVEREVAGRLRPSCASCGETVFLDPKVAVAVVATDDGKILMVKRAIDPMMGRWSLPAGYVDRGEAVEEAAIREVREETGVEVQSGLPAGCVLHSGRAGHTGRVRGDRDRRSRKSGRRGTGRGLFPSRRFAGDALPTRRQDHTGLEGADFLAIGYRKAIATTASAATPLNATPHWIDGGTRSSIAPTNIGPRTPPMNPRDA